MDKEYFMKGGIPPPQPLHLQKTSPPLPWTSSSSDHSLFLPHSTMDHPHFSHFDSNWTSSTADPYSLRHLIGKLGAGEAPILDQITLPNAALAPLPSISTDPGFAERAAKFSCFGSRSFNGRTSQNLPPATAPPPASLHRVASSPALKQNGSPPPPPRNRSSDKKFGSSGANSNEESSVSEQIPSGETPSMNSRKRKPLSRGKNKANLPKGGEGDDDSNSKRSKANEEEENDKNQKPPEPLKDYIHVRARRGQATDSHSLAERVRREKISERMKLLQDLVPGCNKVTGKALMLDEIINYVQSLQRQVEFLSMKLSSVNPSLDFNMESLLSKEMFQQSTMYNPLDSSAPAPFYHPRNVQLPQQHGTRISSTPVDPLPLDADLGTVDGFHHNLPQFPVFSEDDLHSIVQMGFIQNSANFPAQNQASNMKVEL